MGMQYRLTFLKKYGIYIYEVKNMRGLQNFVFDTEKFNAKYKGTRKFCETSGYYPLFLSSLQNEKLYEHILFCNDILHLPPILVFVKYYAEYFNREMTDNEKRGLGACFGYLFQYSGAFHYKSAKPVWVGDRTTGIKNASYFIK